MTSTDGRPDSRADQLLADWADLAGRARRPMEAPTPSGIGGLGTVLRFTAPMAFGLAVVLAVGLVMPPAGGVGGRGMVLAPSPSSADACPVTEANGVHGEAWPATPLDHGAQGILTALAPGGTIEIAAGARGGSGLLWRDTLFAITAPAEAPLVVSGHRWAVDHTDWTASPGTATETVEAQYPVGRLGAGPLRVDLGFPGEGCWEIVAQAGPSQLRYITRVVRAPDRGQQECLVTIPNGAHTSAWPASDLDHGEGGLFTVLWPEGTVQIPRDGVDADGIGWMKFVFQREGAAEGGLRLAGRRIGAETSDPRGSIRSQIPDGYGTTGVQATSIGFPAGGCWEIIAASGTSQLRFRTWVEIAPPTTADLVGASAPVAELAASDGGRGRLWAPGRPTVVTFWGSWCPACTREPETLAGLAANDIDLVLVAVKDVASEVTAAIGTSVLPVLLDLDGSAFAAYGGFGLPLTVFIDGEGVVRSFVAGPMDAASIAAGLEAIEPIARSFSGPSGSPSLVLREPEASPGT